VAITAPWSSRATKSSRDGGALAQAPRAANATTVAQMVCRLVLFTRSYEGRFLMSATGREQSLATGRNPDVRHRAQERTSPRSARGCDAGVAADAGQGQLPQGRTLMHRREVDAPAPAWRRSAPGPKGFRFTIPGGGWDGLRQPLAVGLPTGPKVLARRCSPLRSCRPTATNCQELRASLDIGGVSPNVEAQTPGGPWWSLAWSLGKPGNAEAARRNAVQRREDADDLRTRSGGYLFASLNSSHPTLRQNDGLSSLCHRIDFGRVDPTSKLNGLGPITVAIVRSKSCQVSDGRRLCQGARGNEESRQQQKRCNSRSFRKSAHLD
jgi:hypothetical protein